MNGFNDLFNVSVQVMPAFNDALPFFRRFNLPLPSVDTCYGPQYLNTSRQLSINQDFGDFIRILPFFRRRDDLNIRFHSFHL
jgi:hypothetical protein